jgi:hypothetical protein
MRRCDFYWSRDVAAVFTETDEINFLEVSTVLPILIVFRLGFQ